MAVRQDEFAAYCVELLGSLGGARSRRMFGGHGIYVDDLFVAIIVGERLYLKADDESRGKFEAAGCEPVVYDAKGKRMSMSYYSAPDEAVEAALRARTTKAPPKARRPAAAKKVRGAVPAAKRTR